MARTKSVEYFASTQRKDKANTKSEAEAWGRIAARLGWGLDGLKNEIEAEFHGDARRAYESRLRSL